MTNSKPNYRIDNYSASFENRDILSGVFLRNSKNDISEKTFSFLFGGSSNEDTCSSYDPCSGHCSCQEHTREKDEDKSSDDGCYSEIDYKSCGTQCSGDNPPE